MDIKKTSYVLSVNVYGRGDATKGDGPSHVGFAVHASDSDKCQMHPVRCPDDETYIYDPRMQPLKDPVLWGRCEVKHMTLAQQDRAVETLTAYGEDAGNIPTMGAGNCQDWLAGAAAALEKAGLCNHGEGPFWKSQINCSADQMAQACRDAGKIWVDGNKQSISPELIDARFADAETRHVGKLKDSSNFHDVIGAIGASLNKTEGVGTSVARPFYVSSPFFSKTGTDAET